jgi:hypothetical protein
MTSNQAGVFELRGVVKPLVFFSRHLALLPRCHLLSRQATSNSGMLYSIRSSAGCERVQALAGEKRAKMLGEKDSKRKLHDT